MKKLKKENGFTLVETLLAVLILSLVTMVVVAGIPVAKQAYDKIVDSANAQVLLSTTVTRLRQELWNASVSVDKPVDSNGSLILFNGEAGSKSGTNEGEIKAYYTTISNSEDGIQITVERATGEQESHLLVSKEAATAELVTSFKLDSSGIDDGVITFKNLEVKKRSGTKPLASIDTLQIRTLIPPTE